MLKTADIFYAKGYISGILTGVLDFQSLRKKVELLKLYFPQEIDHPEVLEHYMKNILSIVQSGVLECDAEEIFKSLQIGWVKTINWLYYGLSPDDTDYASCSYEQLWSLDIPFEGFYLTIPFFQFYFVIAAMLFFNQPEFENVLNDTKMSDVMLGSSHYLQEYFEDENPSRPHPLTRLWLLESRKKRLSHQVLLRRILERSAGIQNSTIRLNEAEEAVFSTEDPALEMIAVTGLTACHACFIVADNGSCYAAHILPAQLKSALVQHPFHSFVIKAPLFSGVEKFLELAGDSDFQIIIADNTGHSDKSLRLLCQYFQNVNQEAYKSCKVMICKPRISVDAHDLGAPQSLTFFFGSGNVLPQFHFLFDPQQQSFSFVYGEKEEKVEAFDERLLGDFSAPTGSVTGHR